MNLTTLPNKVLLGFMILLAISSFSFSAETTASKLEKTAPLSDKSREDFPLNVARSNLGAGIECSRKLNEKKAPLGVDEQDLVQTVQNLISSDESLSYPLELGKTSFIITLPFISANKEFSFINDNGSAGKISISVATSPLGFDSPKWKKVSEAVILSNNSFVSVTFPMVECTVMKLDFDITKAGRINAFGVFGETKSVGFTERPQPLKQIQPISEAITYDYATLNNNQAHISHVSSYATPEDYKKANVMIDDNAATHFDFAKGDPVNAAVVDLNYSENIRRISAVYEAGPGTLEFYTLNKLPEGNTETSGSNAKPAKILVLPDDFFKENKPIYTTKTRPDSRKSSTTFELVPVRYVMLRWLPDNRATAWNAPRNHAELLASTSPLFTIPSLLGQITPNDTKGFRIFEINVFGNVTRKRYAIDRGRERTLGEMTRPEVLTPINPPILPPTPTPASVSP